MNKSNSPETLIQQEGAKSVMKSLGKKVAKAAFNEAIQELPGPPGHLVRIIKNEVDKQNKKAKDKKLADNIMNQIRGAGDYNYMAYGVTPEAYRNSRASRRMRNNNSNPANRRIAGGIASLRGAGDYTVHSNSISLSSKVAADTDLVPSFRGSLRETRIQHREYLGDVISSSVSGAFANQTYRINPGIVTTFPWLSVIAQNFDQWKPNGIVVCFKSTSSIYNGSSQALGTVIIASDYDLTDAAYSSKIEMENSEFAVSAKSSDNILHPIECAIGERQVKVLKCRGVTTPTDNLQWYDLCNLQVATQGVTGTSVNLGELWITYDISFYKEQLYGNLFGNSILATFAFGGAATTSNYFGSPYTYPSSTLVMTYTTTTMTFPSTLSAGQFLITLQWTGDSTACTTPTVAFTTNCAASTPSFPDAAGTDTNLTSKFMVTLSGPSAVITLSGGTLPANVTGTYIYITQVNSSVKP